MRVEYLQALVLAVPMLLFTIWAGRMVWRGGHRRAVVWTAAGTAAGALVLMVPALASAHFTTLVLAGTGALLFAPVALGLMIVMATGRR